MDNLNRNSGEDITLQDLLKFKKLERPDEVFWTKFDKQLHDKTLKRLIDTGSIFSYISNALLVICRPAVCLGALAVLTVGIFSYSYRASLSVQPQLAVLNHSSSSLINTILVDLTSVKKNYIKTSIGMDIAEDYHSNVLISASSAGVRYLAGNLDSAAFGQGVTSNTIY